MEVECLLCFNVERQALQVEMLLTAGGMYLQAGAPGDRVMTNMSAPRIMIELPDTEFRPYWDNLLLSHLTAVVARKTGMSRREARPVAEAIVLKMREFSALRLRD